MSDGLFADLMSGELRLATAQFELAPLDPADAEDLFTAFSDPAVVRFMDIDPHVDVSQSRAMIDWAERQRAAGQGVRWAIRRREDGGFVGTCGLQQPWCWSADAGARSAMTCAAPPGASG